MFEYRALQLADGHTFYGEPYEPVHAQKRTPLHNDA